MAAIGGSLESVSLDGREFPVTNDAEVQRKIGGFENEIQSNGDGSARMVKTRVPWSLDGLVVEVDDSRGDHEFLQQLSDSNDYYPIALTYASGEVYQGQGQIVGEMQASSQAATATVSLMGPQTLTKQ
jgi:hypothetical protein